MAIIFRYQLERKSPEIYQTITGKLTDGFLTQSEPLELIIIKTLLTITFIVDILMKQGYCLLQHLTYINKQSLKLICLLMHVLHYCLFPKHFH